MGIFAEETRMGLIETLKKRFFRGKPREELRLGVAFGSGGAKGMAHLGALKAFEEERLRFSFVTGSSIGSIVGALYAKGFTSADMIQVIETLNRREFSKNLRPFADLSFAERFLENYLDGDIPSLPVPFAAWATEENGTGVALKEGGIAKALTASSAIPPFFRAVTIGDKRYYDGAFSNAVPADLCRELGAEFVIGVDLSAFSKPEEEKSRISRLLGSAINRFTPIAYNDDCRSRGYRAADYMLAPDLREFRATDISREAMDRMFECGYDAAKAAMPAIRQQIDEAQRAKSARAKKGRG